VLIVISTIKLVFHCLDGCNRYIDHRPCYMKHMLSIRVMFDIKWMDWYDGAGVWLILVKLW